jgi:hypothetical protein
VAVTRNTIQYGISVHRISRAVKEGGAISGFGRNGKVAVATFLGTNYKVDWRVDSATLGI